MISSRWWWWKKFFCHLAYRQIYTSFSIKVFSLFLILSLHRSLNCEWKEITSDLFTSTFSTSFPLWLWFRNETLTSHESFARLICKWVNETVTNKQWTVFVSMARRPFTLRRSVTQVESFYGKSQKRIKNWCSYIVKGGKCVVIHTTDTETKLCLRLSRHKFQG